MISFFDENGLLSIDEAVMQEESYKKILEDGIVSDEEIIAQTTKVTSLLHDVEKSCSPEQVRMIKRLLSEMSVLYAVYNYKELQSLK